MPSTSPGCTAAASPPPTTSFAQVLPGAPAAYLQAFTTFVFRFKRYVAYISGPQLNILSSPDTLVHVITFNHDLVAIAAEQKSGKIAVAGSKKIWLLGPHTEGWTRVWWRTELFLRREDEGDAAHWLSWGDDGEVLVAGDRMITLFSTLPSSRSGSPVIDAADGDSAEERRSLWSKSVASPLRQADFSPSASLIASCGRYDRLVKIWRRLSFEDGLFDHTYLPHPGAVTHLEWRAMNQQPEERRSSGISGRHDDECEVLFTVANDGILRIWRTGGLHDLEILTLYTTIDLIAAIPQSPSLTIKGQIHPHRAPRYVTILHAEQFHAAVNAAIGIGNDEKTSHSKELLKEMISKEPDVIIAFDGQGRMSAWGIQSIGHKRRPDTPTVVQAYHIAHAEALSLRLPFESPAVCGTWLQDDKLHLLTQTLCDDSEMTWWQGDVEAIFSAAATTPDRFTASAIWTGHDGDVVEVQKSGDSIMSRSHREVTQWRRSRTGKLKPKTSFGVALNVLAAVTINSGQALLTVCDDSFALWDKTGSRVAKCLHATSSAGRLLFTSDQSCARGIFVPDDMSKIVRWTTQLQASSNSDAGHLTLSSIDLTADSSLSDVVQAVPVSSPFDTDEACIVSISKAGLISCSLISEVAASSTALETFATFDTDVREPTHFTANKEIACFTSEDSKTLIVVDLTDGYVEHRKAAASPVKQLVCHTPESRSNFLAVVHDDRINILAQGPYHHGSNSLVWHHVKSVSIHSTGLRPLTVAWTPDSCLAIAAGNTLFIASADIEVGTLDRDIREVIDVDSTIAQHNLPLSALTTLLKGPVPVWHPDMLAQLLRHGHYALSATVLAQLAQKLKFWSAGDDLSETLDQDPDALIAQSRDSSGWLDSDKVADLKEQLDEKHLPRISHVEQDRLRYVIDAIVFLKEHVNGLDSNALHYLFEWKLQLLSADNDVSTQVHGTGKSTPTPPFVPRMGWREICFAYHSTTQQPLLDILVLHYDNKLTWQIAQKLGVMAWLSAREALEQVFEQLGQTAYRADSPPDPVNASLYYLALHKKTTLVALWRIATWHKEQRTTMNFLKRDFSQSDAQTAAKKNAYALMGKRRFHYAAAFFLLANDAASAASLLAGQCEDAQFAIAVARLYCGDGSPVVQKLLEDRIMPQAEKNRDRWLMSWCYSVTLRKEAAAKVLVTPLDGVKTWQQDDPTTLLLYKHLRKETSEHEYDAVLRAARILRRMGLWLIALDLIGQWKFQAAKPPKTNGISNGTTNGAHTKPSSMLDDYVTESAFVKPAQPPSMLDGFTEPPAVPATPMDEKSTREAKAAELLAKIKAKKAGATAPNGDEKKKPPPTQFKEPDPNSLLDSFGF